MNTTKKGFTLVELIVVVTILAILSTIWFVAYSWYLSWVRDANRISQMHSMVDALYLYNTRNQLPIADNNIEIRSWNKIIWYQWYIWENILESIEYSSEWIDPKDKTYFTYRHNAQSKYFSIMALLENDSKVDELVTKNTSYANIYKNRTPYIIWSKVWVIIDSHNNPIQEISTIQDQWNIDIQDVWTNEYTVLFDNNYTFTASGNGLLPILPNYDCKRLKDFNPQLKDGVYNIDPDGDNNRVWVYCIMQYDGGWWTLATMLATNRTTTAQQDAANLFDTWNSDIVTSLDKDIRDKWSIQDLWNDSYNRDILIQCDSEFEEYDGYEHPFVIYNFDQTDIGNLTKTVKQSTPFSSKILQARWKSHDYKLATNYGASSKDNSIYFVRSEDEDARLFVLHARLGAGNNVGTTYTYDEKSPAFSDYISSWSTEFKLISPTNYCYSATRLNLDDFEQ